MKELEELLEKLKDRADYRKCNLDWLKSVDGALILEAIEVLKKFLEDKEHN